MTWMYRRNMNVHGCDQVFDYRTSPAVCVCGGCHCEYENVGNGLQCIDCRNPDKKDEDETTFVDETNEYGFPQTYQVDRECKTPVCPHCHALVMPNRGQGTLCTECQHDFDVECDHDYHDHAGL